MSRIAWLNQEDACCGAECCEEECCKGDCCEECSEEEDAS